jgi:hypothetical protein
MKLGERVGKGLVLATGEVGTAACYRSELVARRILLRDSRWNPRGEIGTKSLLEQPGAGALLRLTNGFDLPSHLLRERDGDACGLHE